MKPRATLIQVRGTGLSRASPPATTTQLLVLARFRALPLAPRILPPALKRSIATPPTTTRLMVFKRLLRTPPAAKTRLLVGEHSLKTLPATSTRQSEEHTS